MKHVEQENTGETNKADMAIIDDVSQFVMFTITIITAVILLICLPSIEPIIAQTEEPKTLGGSPAFWMTVYIIIALWMLHAWGYKPLAALYKAESFQGRFLSTLRTIFNLTFIWGVLLGIVFIAFGMLLELFEGAAPASNLIAVGLLIGAWALIEYKRYAAAAAAFNAPVLKPHPMREILKHFKKS